MNWSSQAYKMTTGNESLWTEGSRGKVPRGVDWSGPEKGVKTDHQWSTGCLLSPSSQSYPNLSMFTIDIYCL